MRQRTKIWIGWILLTGVLVAVLAIFFGVMIVRNLIVQRKMPALMQWLSGQQTELTETGTTTTPSVTTTQPTKEPVPTVTSKPTRQPTPTATTVETSEPTLPPVPTGLPEPTPTKIPNETDVVTPFRLIESIYEEASSAVVGIRVEVPASGSQTMRTNEGSGLVIDEKGIVVTQASLFDVAINRQGMLLPDAEIDILVQETERVFSGTLLGRDLTTNLAVIRVEDTIVPFNTLKLSDRETLKTGQMVLSIGFPDLLETSGGLSTGYIIALEHQMLLEDGTSIVMLEADLQMNQRSFGGPILNLDGDVIALSYCGINGEPYSTNMHALSADAVMQIADRIINQTKTDQPTWLGVAILEPDRFIELQRLYSFPDGLYIANVVADSPAYIADLRKGDVIVSINDEQLTPLTPLARYLKDQPVGTALDFKVYRQSENRTLSVRAYLQTYGP